MQAPLLRRRRRRRRGDNVLASAVLVLARRVLWFHFRLRFFFATANLNLVMGTAIRLGHRRRHHNQTRSDKRFSSTGPVRIRHSPRDSIEESVRQKNFPLRSRSVHTQSDK